MMGNKKDQMHPDDMKNLFIFFILAAMLYFTYDVYILQPQKAALKAQQVAAAQQQTQVQAAQNPQEEEKPLERKDALSESPRVQIDNGKIAGSISLRGARLDDMALLEYFDTLEDKKENKNNVVILSPKETEFTRYIEFGWVADDKSAQMPGQDTLWQVSSVSDSTLRPGEPVTLHWRNSEGLSFERKYEVDENYLITVTQKIINNSGREVTLHPYGLISQKGLPSDMAGRWIQHEGPIGFIGDKLAEIKYLQLRKTPDITMSAAQGWTGITDKYWLNAMIPAQGQDVQYGFHYSGIPPEKNQKDTGRYQADFTGPAQVLKSGQSVQVTSSIFTGPKKVLTLEKYGRALGVPNFDLAVNFGWFWFFSKPFFYALHFLGQITGNMGFAIIFLTILIRGSVFPLTNVSYKSFAKMKKVTPQIVELRKIYADDKGKLQQELMALYQREGVNPLAGCIPMVLQIPIFFALYKVIFLTIEIRHAPFIGWIHDLSSPDPTNIFNLFGLIDWAPPVFLHVGIWPCLMLAAMLIQKKLNPPPQDPIQRDMANYMPFVMTYILSKFAAGLVIYWTFSALIGLMQQMIIMHRLGVPIYLLGQSEEEKKLEEGVAKGPAVHPLAEMVEEEVEEALFGGDDDRPKVSPPKPRKKKKKK